MKRFLSVLCVLAMLLSIVPAAAFAAAQDLQALIDAGADEPIVLEADASDITVTRDTYVDLNGHDINGVTVLSGTLYCMDSQTADYTVDDGVYGKVTNATGAVKAAEGYLQVGESFHAVDLDIYAMTLRAADVGVYYKSSFAADEIVAAEVESFGVALSVVTAPNASNLDSYCGYSVFTGFEAGEGANAVGTSTLLKGIMKAANGDSKNAKNAAMPVYGRAYIKTSEGYFFGETVKRSLQEQVEAIDKIWNSLTDSQKTPVLGLLEGYTSVMENWNIPNIQGIQVPGADAEIEIPIEVTAENGIVTEAVTVEQDGVSVTVPAGTKLAANASGLTVTVTPKEVSDAGLTLEESEVLMPMDVHVDGLAADNAAPLTIYLGKIMPENLNMGNYAVYHVENGKANEMTLIGVNEEFTAHNQYKYTLDGELTLYVANFSEFALLSEEAKWEGKRDYSWYDADAETLYIRNADQLAAFGAIVGGMANPDNDPDVLTEAIAQDSFEGQTIVLLADINIGDLDSENGIVFYPVGYWNSEETYEKNTAAATEALSSGFYAFMGTFDGNGNTISNFYQNTWEMKGDHNWYNAVTEQYYRDGMGLFGKVYGGTVKNLTVDNFSSDGEIATTGVIAAYADFGATFENIAIFNCNPRVYNIGNGGIVGCVGWYTKDVTTTPVTFKNISVDQSNKISALWGTYDVSCGGIVGQYYATSGQDSAGNPKNAGMTFTNCHVAAVMDVHNDVCANYQYYWYRYSGMMIGTIRANIKDKNGYTVADTRGIEFIDCTYTLGDWNQYWYCELVKNSLASYTHDHQFSRLTTIKSLSEIQDENGNWDTEGNFVIPNAENTAATCYHIFKDSEGNLYQHFHDKGDETNGNQPYETVNGVEMLKEDRTCYFIPFNQIYNGLGYGVKPTYKYADDPIYTDGDANDLKEIAGGTVKAEPKFEELGTVTTYKPGQTITLGQLVKAVVEDSMLSKTSIYAAVSPATENDDVSATYALDLSDWKSSTITFAEGSTGSAKIVITDYFYCTPTVIILNPETAAPKFEAITGIEKDAYTQITLGDLFELVNGATISADVTATVTDPNGNVTTVTGTSSDWATKTIDLTKDGTWTVTINDDDAYCSVTTATFSVNKVDKFTKKFDKDFLYRVGNLNEVPIKYLFDLADGITESDVGNVTVTVEGISSDLTGKYAYASSSTWNGGKLTFPVYDTETNQRFDGVIKVEIVDDCASNPETLYLEVVDATNITSATSRRDGVDVVLLSDVKISSNGSVYYDNCTFYGNGFTYDVSGGVNTAVEKTDGSFTYYHGIINLTNVVMDNTVVEGEVYDKYGVYSKQEDYTAAIVATGSTIQNCYIANCSSPVRADGCKLINTTLYGGTVANLILTGGVNTLTDVTTINYNDEARDIVGLGILISEGASDTTKLVLNGYLKQHNFVCESDNTEVPETYYNSMEISRSMFNSMFDTSFSAYHFTTESGEKCVNTGIISMNSNFKSEDITDYANTGYTANDSAKIKVAGQTFTGAIYTLPATGNVIDNEFAGYQEVQGDYLPKFDFSLGSQEDADDGTNDERYLYGTEDLVNAMYVKNTNAITLDLNQLATDSTVKKYGTKLALTVICKDSSGIITPSNNIVTLTETGSYVLEFVAEDAIFYDVNGETINKKVERVFEVPLYLDVKDPAAADATITVNSSALSGEYVLSGTDYKYKMYPLKAITSIMDDANKDGTLEAFNYKSNIDTMSISYGASNAFDGTTTVTINYTGGQVLTFVLGKPSGLSSPSTANGGKTLSVTTDSSNGIVLTSDGKTSAQTGTWTITSWSFKGTSTTVITDSTQVTINFTKPGCVTPDTLVTLADGTQKEIQSVKVGDEVLVWNFYTGAYDVAPVTVVFNHGTGIHRVLHLKFDDDTVVKVIADHGFYDVNENNFVFIEESNVEAYVGHEFVKQNGTEYATAKLVEYYVVEEYTTAYAIFTYKHLNCILEGMFTITPTVDDDNFYMPFEMAEGMKYDEEKMQADIEKYGLYTYEDFDHVLTYEQFVALNIEIFKVSVGKGLVTYEKIIELIQTYIPQ